MLTSIFAFFCAVSVASCAEKTSLHAIYEDAKKFAVDMDIKRAMKAPKAHKPFSSDKSLNEKSETHATHAEDGCVATSAFLGEEAARHVEDIKKCGAPHKAPEPDAIYHASDLQKTETVQEKILVFVSFSMPIESLKQLMSDTDRHHAVLVMRGLKNNSFKETAAFVETLGKDEGKDYDNESEGGFELNPALFTTYQIKHVPVFVRVKGDKEIGRLSGNVSLNFAAQKLKEIPCA